MAKGSKGSKGSKGKGKKGEGAVTLVKRHFAENCPHIVDMRFPHLSESTGALAEKLVIFREKKAEFVAAVRAWLVGGSEGEMPTFSVKNFPNPNTGMMSRTAFSKLVDQQEAGEVVEFGPTYNPVLVELASEMEAKVVRRGSGENAQKQPKDWDEDAWGRWTLTDDKLSGWVIDPNPLRPSHKSAAEELIDGDNIEKCIVKVGSHRYIVGNGQQPGSAVMRVYATERGTFRAGDQVRKEMSISGADINHIVFRIEDKSNCGGGVEVKGNWGDIQSVVFMPGEVLTAGFLFDGDTQLEAKDIRAIPEPAPVEQEYKEESDYQKACLAWEKKEQEKAKGIKFKTVRQVLDKPLVGKATLFDKMWPAIQEILGSKGLKEMREREGRSDDDELKTNPRKKALDNCRTTCRVAPSALYPHAFRAAQCDMVPYMTHDSDGNLSMGIVIGDRSNEDYNVGVYAAVEYEAEEKPKRERKVKAVKAVKVKAEKPVKVKAEKPAKTPKVKTPKATKPKSASKPKKKAAVSSVEDNSAAASDLPGDAERMAEIDAAEEAVS